ncbi:BTB/POZ domain-containing protein 6-like [Oculina patagonica]
MASTSEQISEPCQASVSEDSSERWQASRSTVLERNKFMFNNPVMSDIKFAFPNSQTIPAHKYVLAISSSVFFAMFYGDLAEQGESIDITDFDPDDFLQFLRFLYYDDTNFQDVDRAIQLCYLADKYDVPSLARECVNFLDRIMEPLEALDVIQHAFQLKNQDLEEASWEVIDYNAKEILADASFLEVKHEFLLLFLERSSLRIDEVMLFEAVDRWAARRCEEANKTVDGTNKRSVLGEDLLKLVRFSLISPKEFSDVVMPTGILLQTEVIDVFKQFTSVPVPGGLKFSVLPRIRWNEPFAPFCSFSMGWSNTDARYNGSNMPLRSSIQSMEKAGMLTFTVSKNIKLSGVRIITDTAGRQPSCRVSLSLHAQGSDKKIREIKDTCFGNKAQEDKNCGHIDVLFNRPFCLSKNTCYTIETKTDTTQNRNFFVWFVPQSLLSDSSQKRTYTLDTYCPYRSSGVSGHCSGHYTECIPSDACYKGEIMALFLQE